jgi:TRAP transporter TAXI family solute receptor
MTKGKMKGPFILAWVMLFVIFTASTQAWAENPDWPKRMVYAGSRAGSGSYAVGVGISELITKHVGVRTVPEAGAAAKNAVLLHKKEVELGNVQSGTLYDAVRGTGLLSKFGKMNIRLMFSSSLTTPCAFIVRRDSGITSVTDLKGKKVMATNPSSPAFTRSADMMLEAMGMTREDIEDISFSSFSEASPALKDGRVSAAIHPQPSIGIAPFLQEFNASVPARLMAAPWEKLEALLGKYPYFSKAVLRAKYYGDITDNSDLMTIGFRDIVVCGTDLPEGLVYEIMKAIFGHLDKLYTYHPVAKPWTADPLAVSLAPYHPGAIKYYKEKGLWTKEMESKQKQLLAEVGVPR